LALNEGVGIREKRNKRERGRKKKERMFSNSFDLLSFPPLSLPQVPISLLPTP
jgi:hypothetical protein